MTIKNTVLSGFMLSAAFAFNAAAGDTMRYTGNTLVNVDYHHGQLRPVVGVHNIQVFRANREHPEWAEGFGWTYNHAPMIAYWNNTFYVEYLSDSVGESIPPGQTLMLESKDGYNWSKPQVIFPVYRIPDGTTKDGRDDKAKDLDAVTHQRMGFYVSKSNRLFALAFYGIVFDEHDDPNDGNGIGRVIREVLPDGKLGPIYFLRFNHGWDEKKAKYPFYKSSKDKGLKKACEEILNSPLMMQQMVEEADRNDPLIPIHKQYKAFNYYHLEDGRVVGLWKNALTNMSTDEGKTWWENAVRAPGFVNGTAKIWGQKTSDGKYATVYNPSDFRWPLAASVSDNGLDYKNLLLVNGEISAMRYGGNYKSYGPQYMRGIIEGNGTPPDGKMWVTYSMNKEDIWVSSVPVPLTDVATKHADEVFNTKPDGKELEGWNIFSPLWAPVSVGKAPDGEKALILKDADPFDYATAEKVIPASEQLVASFSVIPAQSDFGQLDIEFMNGIGQAGIRLTFDSTGTFWTKAGARYKGFMQYEAGKEYKVKVTMDASSRFYTIYVNDKKEQVSLMFQPLHNVARVLFRTGEVRRFPTADTPADHFYDLDDAGEKDKEAVYYIKYLKTETP